VQSAEIKVLSLESAPPKIRRKPKRVSQEQWERFVEGLFPKLSTMTHRLVPIASGSGAVQFDVVPILPDDHAITSQPVVKRHERHSTYRIVLRGDIRGDSHCTCSVFRYGVYGVCSHILFARSQLGHPAANSNAIRPFSEIVLRYGLEHEIVFHPATNVPGPVLNASRHCFDANKLFRFERYAMLKKLIERAVECRHELRIDDSVFARIAFEMQQRERHRKITAAFPRGVQSGAFDSLLTVPLATYQREAALNAATTGRFLLFDSPGLGRRRTAVAAAEILAQTADVRRVLVLTNMPTLHTWHVELQQSTSRHLQVIFGSPAKRSQCYTAEVQYAVARYDDLKDDLAAITGRMKPDLVILDNPLTLRHHGTDTARIVRRLESEYLFILSGGPPDRMPGSFVSFVDMIDRYRSGLLDDFLARHQQFDMQNNSVNYVNMCNVANTLPKHFRRFESTEYRRSLPELLEHDRYLPLTEPQAKRHADLQSRLFHLVSGFRRQASEGDTGTSPETRSPKPELPALHEIQTIIAEMLNTANDMTCCRLETGNMSGGCKIDAMYDLLQEHLEPQQAKTVVFANDVRLLQLAGEKLAKSSVECDLIDRYMPSNSRENAAARFRRESDCPVLFMSDGVDDQLVFRNVQLVIHLDFPWEADCIRQRQSHIKPLKDIMPCHSYQLISYGTIEHWLAKLRGGLQLLVGSNLRDGQSVVLLDEPDRVKFIEYVFTVLEQVKEPPMVLPS